MVAPPLAHVSPAVVRATAMRAVALSLDRSRVARAIDRMTRHSDAVGRVHPISGTDDELGSVIAGAFHQGQRGRWQGRRLFRPDTIPAGLDPGLDRALAGLDQRSRLGLVLRHWLGWNPARIAAALGVGVAEARALVAAASEALGALPDQIARHLTGRAEQVAVPARRQGSRRPATMVPVLGAGAMVLILALFAGAASAPLPTVVGPEPETLSLVDAALPAVPEVPDGALELRAAAPGEALEWQTAPLPAGVAFRWVVPADGGFVALGVAPADAIEPLVHPVGFWASPDGLAWTEVAADRSAFGPDHVVSGIAAGAGGIAVVGGEEHAGTEGALVRPAVWWLADGALRWERAGLRTTPVGSPVSVRLVYRDLTVVAGGGRLAAFGRAELALTGRDLPPGFTYDVDEVGVTLLGPAGARVERLRFEQLGLGDRAAARLVRGEQRGVAWSSQDGLRWDTVPLGTDAALESPAFALGRFWATDGSAALSSPNGAQWGRVELGGDGEVNFRSVAGGPSWMAIATGNRTLVVADAAGWSRVTLPPAENALTGARWAAGGELGIAAFGTMGSDVGEVIVPQVTVPGNRGRSLQIDLFTGELAVISEDGAVRHRGGYYSGAVFRVDLAAGTFAVVDAFGDQQLSGRLDAWADAVAAAYRTPYPPDGAIGLWYSSDGEAWSLQGDADGFAATGFPASVAVGGDRVVVAAAKPTRAGRSADAQLWVGTTGG